MKTLLILLSVMVLSSSAFALTLFNDLNMAGNRITNVTEIRGTEATPLRLENVAQVQFANGQVLSNVASGDLRFPDGLTGVSTVWVWIDSTVTYTVPVSRTLYIVHLQANNNTDLQCQTNNGSFRSVWNLNSSYRNQGAWQHSFVTPLIIGERNVLRSSNYSRITLMGYLVPSRVPVLQVSVDWSNPYTVPSGRRFVVLTGYAGSSVWLQSIMGGTTYDVWYFTPDYKHYGYGSAVFDNPLIFPSGAQVRCGSSGYWIHLTGYLE